MKIKIEMTEAELLKMVRCYEELKAYRKTGYTPEQVQELHDKHWDECRQIALYDDQVEALHDQVAHLKGILYRSCRCPSDCSD